MGYLCWDSQWRKYTCSIQVDGFKRLADRGRTGIWSRVQIWLEKWISDDRIQKPRLRAKVTGVQYGASLTFDQKPMAMDKNDFRDRILVKLA